MKSFKITKTIFKKSSAKEYDYIVSKKLPIVLAKHFGKSMNLNAEDQKVGKGENFR